MVRIRKKLATTKPTKRRKSLKEDEDDPFYIPKYMQRDKWTKEDWERSKRAWQRVDEQKRDDQRQVNKRIYIRATRARHQKILHEYLRKERKQAKGERQDRASFRRRQRYDRDNLVLSALQRGDETSAQISKRTGLSPVEIRRALRRLVKTKRAVNTSGRRYAILVRKRKRLSDINL